MILPVTFLLSFGAAAKALAFGNSTIVGRGCGFNPSGAQIAQGTLTKFVAF
jgi:hypothetical protein